MALDINIGALRRNCFRTSKERGKFMVQIRVPGGYLKAKHLSLIQKIAEEYGQGDFHFGMRQCFAIPGIDYENIEKVNQLLQSYIQEVELELCQVEMSTDGGFPEIASRNITACIGGMHCPKANINTQQLANKAEKIIYPSPYHIKISVTGCPNDCAKAHFCDFGIVGLTKPEYDASRCIGCGKCVEACKNSATRVLSGNNGRVEKDTCCCVGCGECILACPTGAWSRSATPYFRILIGGRTGKQYPRMGKTFVDFITEDVLFAILKNWQGFSAEVLKGEPRYLHGGHLIDMAGYHKFKEYMLQGVKLNPEARVADQIYWSEIEYRGRIHVKPV